MRAEQAASATAPTTSTDGPSPDETKPSGETKTEETPSGESEVKTSTSEGSETDEKKDFWDNYKSDEERRKALNETKQYAAKLSKELQEAKAAKAPEKTEVKEPETKTEPVKAEPDVEKLDVDTFISQAINLKEGHTEDQLRIAQINYEVLKFHKDVLNPAQEAAKTAKTELEKVADKVRDQKAYVAKTKEKAEKSDLYADDLKEALNELRDLEKAHTDARLDHREAADRLAEALKEERDKRAEGRTFAQGSVERINQKSLESKAQTERAETEKRTKEESNKAWTLELEKAMKANGLTDVSEKMKKVLSVAAYDHVNELIKAGQVTDKTDLQILIKDAFEPIIELKSKAPVLEGAVERKKSLTDEPGPGTRNAKAGEEKPQTLAEMKAAARRGLKSIKA